VSEATHAEPRTDVTAAGLDPWYLENLVCPVDKSRLRLEGAFLVSEAGRRYPVVEGMPVMLVEDAAQTIGVAARSLTVANAIANGEPSDEPPLYLSVIGGGDAERAAAKRLYDEGSPFEPVVAALIGATSGFAYRHLVGEAVPYPIPAFRFPTPAPGRLLDVGCNWGRWCIAATRAGHQAVGIDPQLVAVLAARRVAAQLGADARFVVGDARFLPFPPHFFDYAWSYSVLQHFAREDVVAALAELDRVVRTGGEVRVQMANGLGVRSFFHMARRGFRAPRRFEVRYWTPPELRRAFQAAIGDTRLTADCYLGLGLQWSDFARMSPVGKAALVVSETLRRASTVIPPLAWFADSLFCTARQQRAP
jgi:SAM-dependent methyltransferase/uncharacterized protein YbaR (Trm112 family)